MIRKIFLALFFSFVNAATWAQIVAPKFELKATGFVGPDSTKNYIVIEAPKMSKADLYKKTLTYLNGYYQNPAAVLSNVDQESSIVKYSIKGIKGEASRTYSMNYEIQLTFKEGKIRVQPYIADIREGWEGLEKTVPFYISSTQSNNPNELKCIWIETKGKTILFNKPAKVGIENWLNEYVTGLTRYLDEKW